MNDDLAFVSARLPGYRAYGDEDARHDSDMRARAFVGERLSEASTRLGAQLDDTVKARVEALLLRCIFADNAVVSAIQHAELDEAGVAALIRSDRTFVELGERLRDVSAGELPALLDELDRHFDERRTPQPVSGEAR